MTEHARHDSLRADLALVLVTAIWGTTFVVNRLVLDSAPPLLFLAVRFGLGAAVLLVLSRGRPSSPGLLRDGVFDGILLAVSIGCQIAGQLFTSASKTAFITGLSVPLVPVVGYLVSRRVPTAANALGLALATAGFAVFAWPRDARGVDPGDLLVLLTAVLFAVVIHHVAESAPRHDATRYAAVQISFAAIGVLAGRLAVTPLLGRPETFFRAEARPLPATWGFAVAVLWMSIVATVVTFVVQTWAQARMPATHAAIIFALEPVWTSLFAWAALGERLAPRELWGAVLILAGIVASELPLSRR